MGVCSSHAANNAPESTALPNRDIVPTNESPTCNDVGTGCDDKSPPVATQQAEHMSGQSSKQGVASGGVSGNRLDKTMFEQFYFKYFPHATKEDFQKSWAVTDASWAISNGADVQALPTQTEAVMTSSLSKQQKKTTGSGSRAPSVSVSSRWKSKRLSGDEEGSEVDDVVVSCKSAGTLTGSTTGTFTGSFITEEPAVEIRAPPVVRLPMSSRHRRAKSSSDVDMASMSIYSPSMSRSRGVSKARNCAGRRVLVFESNSLDRELASTNLQRFAFEIRACATVKEVIEKSKEKFDVAVLSMVSNNLESTQGLIAHIRGFVNTRIPIFVLVDATTFTETQRQGLESHTTGILIRGCNVGHALTSCIEYIETNARTPQPMFLFVRADNSVARYLPVAMNDELVNFDAFGLEDMEDRDIVGDMSEPSSPSFSSGRSRRDDPYNDDSRLKAENRMLQLRCAGLRQQLQKLQKQPPKHEEAMGSDHY